MARRLAIDVDERTLRVSILAVPGEPYIIRVTRHVILVDDKGKPMRDAKGAVVQIGEPWDFERKVDGSDPDAVTIAQAVAGKCDVWADEERAKRGTL